MCSWRANNLACGMCRICIRYSTKMNYSIHLLLYVHIQFTVYFVLIQNQIWVSYYKCNDVGYVCRINTVVSAVNSCMPCHTSLTALEQCTSQGRIYSNQTVCSIPLLRREEPCSHSFWIESHWLHNVMTSKGRLLNLFLVMQSGQAWHNASTFIKTWKVKKARPQTSI